METDSTFVLSQWDTNYIYLIMEYCGGGDLSNFIRSRKTLTEIEVKYFLQQLGNIIFHVPSVIRDMRCYKD